MTALRLVVDPPSNLLRALPAPGGGRTADGGGGAGPHRPEVPAGSSAEAASWLALAAGAAQLVTSPSTPSGSRDLLVAWLAGRRGPWRRQALRIDGRALGHRRAAARVRAGLVTIAPPVLAPEVSVADHLAAAAPRRRVEDLLEQVPKLAGRGQDPAGVLSGGERQMVAWARAALVAPRVVLLDRAATGLDGEALGWVSERLAGWREAGCVAVVCAGRAEEAEWPLTTRPNGRVPGPHG